MSSLKDLASLIMIPSLYKDGRLDTVKPLGNSIIHPDATGNNDGTDGTTPAEGNFTFSRGSNLAATRVDVNGLIEKGRENLLLQSNQFDTTWGRVGISVTSGQAGYNGTNDAWLITKTADAYRHIVQGVTGTGVRTLSVYAKAGTLDVVSLFYRNGSGNDTAQKFNLTSGTLAGTSGTTNLIHSSIQDVGAGWYRCSLTYNHISGSTIRIYPDFSETDAGNIYIQDAQLEAGLVATDYIETGASTAQAGILEDMPRLDYSGSCPALLLEPQRTNQVTNSEYFDAWIQNAVDLDFGYLAPDGTYSAYKVTDNTGQNNASLYIGAGLYNGFTRSIWARTTSGTGSLDLCSYFENTNNTFTITEEWQRFDVSETTTAVGLGNFYAVDFRGGGLNEVIIWGAQAELGSYPTSYIPTYGSSVTRSADDMTTTFSSALATNGSATIFFHELGLSDSDDISTSAGRYRYQKDSNNYVSLTTNVTAWRVRIQSGSTSNFRGLNNHLKTDDVKIAVVVSSTHFSIFANGVKEIDNEALAATADFSSIDDFITFIQEEVGVRRAVQHAVFPTALTDSECIALTTL